MNKEQSIKIHARKRFGERFGLRLTKGMEADIITQIQTNRAVFIRRNSLRVAIYEVTIPVEGTIHVVYDRRRKVIITGYRPREEVKCILDK